MIGLAKRQLSPSESLKPDRQEAAQFQSIKLETQQGQTAI